MKMQVKKKKTLLKQKYIYSKLSEEFNNKHNNFWMI